MPEGIALWFTNHVAGEEQPQSGSSLLRLLKLSRTWAESSKDFQMFSAR
jgi:hypothetical protein